MQKKAIPWRFLVVVVVVVLMVVMVVVVVVAMVVVVVVVVAVTVAEVVGVGVGVGVGVDVAVVVVEVLVVVVAAAAIVKWRHHANRLLHILVRKILISFQGCSDVSVILFSSSEDGCICLRWHPVFFFFLEGGWCWFGKEINYRARKVYRTHKPC